MQPPSRQEPRGIDKGVEIVDLPTPHYPRSCRRRGEQGLVVLEAEVLPDGCVGRINVIERPPAAELVRAAVEAIRRAVFAPAMRNGRPVAETVRIPIRFQLQ